MNEPQSPDLAPEFHTDMPVGEILRRTRVHYGQTLEQIGQILRIRPSQLEALETGDVAQLPGRVYAIGFVRAYSEYLGLDGDKMVWLFKKQSVGAKAKPELHFPVAAVESKVPTFPAVFIGLFLTLAVIVGLAAFVFTGHDEEEIPSIPDTMQQQSLSEAPAVIDVPAPPEQSLEGEADADSAASPAQPVQRVIIVVEDNSWVEIRDRLGKVLISQVLKPGDQYLVPNEPGYIMSTGNAGGITIRLDGKDLPKLGNPAQVKRNISLNPSDLLARP